MNNNIRNELDRIVDTLANTGIVSQIFLFCFYTKPQTAILTFASSHR